MGEAVAFVSHAINLNDQSSAYWIRLVSADPNVAAFCATKKCKGAGGVIFCFGWCPKLMIHTRRDQAAERKK